MGLIRALAAIEVTVVNTLNKVVYSETSEKIAGNKLLIDLSNQSKGIYFIKLKSDKIEKTIKIILQ